MPPKKTPTSASAAAAPLGAQKMFLIYGSDDLSATRKADELVAQLCPPEEQDFGLERLQPEADMGQVDSVCTFLRNVMEALLTPSFLGGKKTVFVRAAPYFDPMSEPGKFTSVKAEVERLVEHLKKGLLEGVSLVILTHKVHKATAFYKLFQTCGEVFAFDAPEQDRDAKENFIPQVKGMLAARKLVMPPSVFAAFIDRVGYNLRQIENEIEKLSVYSGERTTLTLDDIQLMIAPMRESKFWEFADTFCSGDLAATLRTMQQMFAQKVSPVALIVNLQNRLREIVVLSDCLKRGWAKVSGGDWPKLSWNLPPEGESLLTTLAKDPRSGNPFAIAKMAAQANRLPPSRWYRWLQAAVDAQAAMTGGAAIAPEIVLEGFTLRTLGE